MKNKQRTQTLDMLARARSLDLHYLCSDCAREKRVWQENSGAVFTVCIKQCPVCRQEKKHVAHYSDWVGLPYD